MAAIPGTAPGRLRGGARPSRGRGDGRSAWLFLSPNLIGFLLFTLLPIVASLVISLFEWPLIGAPVFNGLANYASLLHTDPVFARILLNTVVYVVGYVALNLIVSLGLAVWLTTKLRARSLLRVVFFLPVVTPMVASAIVWRMLFTPNQGIIDWVLTAVFHVAGPNWLGSPVWAMPAVIVMSVWQGFGYNMLLFVAGLESIPESLLEAARIDGAGAWSRFWRIRLPMLSPVIFFGVVMTLITSFQVFTQPYVLTGGGPGVDTETLVFYLYQKGFQF
ncbi:MAG: sugar ABC transporter permease, partial [Candidatus Dormiibacterota bacterium]